MSQDSREVMRKADALMRRRRFVAGQPEPSHAAEMDIPILTEVVPHSGRAEQGQAALAGPSVEQIRQTIMDEFAQALRELRLPLHDLAELWMAQRAPELLEEEMRALRTRFSARLLSAARAELLPQLARMIDEITATHQETLRRKP